MSHIVKQLYDEAIEIRKTCFLQQEMFRQHIKSGQRLVFDTETTGIDFGVPSYLYLNDKLQVKVNNPVAFGISLCILYKNGLALFWGRIGTPLYDEIINLLSKEGTKIGHNVKYDIRILRGQGFKVAGPFDCTLTMSRIINDNRKKHSLKSLGEMICPEMSGWEDPVKAQMRNIKARFTRMGHPKNYANYSFLPDKDIGTYSMIDAFMTYILWMKYSRRIEETHKFAYAREIKTMLAAIEVEERGIWFDRRRAKREIIKLEHRCDVLSNRIKGNFGSDFNPESPKQLYDAMINIGFQPRQLVHKGKPSTDAKTLARIKAKPVDALQGKIVDHVLQLRSHRKIISSYLKPLTYKAGFNNGIIYCSINSADTRTGRMSISSPSLQNIPRPTSGYDASNSVRACLGPRRGHTWFLFDYSQIELVYFCLLAGAKHLVRAYNEGADLHTEMTKLIHGDKALGIDGVVKPELRQRTKSINFGVIYGMGINGLSEQLGVSKERAEEIMQIYLDKIPVIREFRDECAYIVRKQGYIDCLFGRRYTCDPAESYKIVNKRVQGGTAQVLKTAILNIMRYIKKCGWEGIHLVLPIHDELIFEVNNHNGMNEKIFVRIIKEQMQRIYELTERKLFLRVEAKKAETNWAEKKEIECVV